MLLVIWEKQVRNSCGCEHTFNRNNRDISRDEIFNLFTSSLSASCLTLPQYRKVKLVAAIEERREFLLSCLKTLALTWPSNVTVSVICLILYDMTPFSRDIQQNGQEHFISIHNACLLPVSQSYEIVHFRFTITIFLVLRGRKLRNKSRKSE